MHGGHVDDKTCRNINNTLNRSRNPNKEHKTRKLNGYVLFYQQEFKNYRAKQDEIGVTGIAKLIGKKWRGLTEKQRDKYTTQARKKMFQ